MLKKFSYILGVITFMLFLPSIAYAQQEESLDSTQEDSATSWEDYDWEGTFEDLQNDLEQEYDYGVDTSDISEEEAAAAGIFAFLFGGIFLVIWIFFMLVGYVYGGLTMMTIANKLGEKNSWLAWIPIANIYLITKMGGFTGWMFLLFFIPFVNFVFGIVLMMKIAERRGFPNWLGLLVLVPIYVTLVPSAWVMVIICGS